MKIGSTPPNSQPPLDNSAGPEMAARTESSQRPGDVVQISESVRSCLGNSEGHEFRPGVARPAVYCEADIRSASAERGAETGDKLGQIRARVAAGFYEQPWVQEIIAGRIADELQGPSESTDQ